MSGTFLLEVYMGDETDWQVLNSEPWDDKNKDKILQQMKSKKIMWDTNFYQGRQMRIVSLARVGGKTTTTTVG